MRTTLITTFLLAAALPAWAQEEPKAEPRKQTFDHAAQSVFQNLSDSVRELEDLRAEMADDLVPLNRRLNELEAELSRVQREHQEATRELNRGALGLTNLERTIKERRDEVGYLSNLIGEYIRSFEARLHIAEVQRYEEQLERAKLAPDNSTLTEQQVFQVQAELIDTSIDRLEEALGGVRFEGTAVNPGGLVKPGTFTMIGPAALFRSADGADVGTAEQRLGSLEPTIIPFARVEDTAAAAALVSDGAGLFTLDATLGDAHKVDATEEETFLEHVKKGGPVMIPIFVMAGLALLVALGKWIGMAFIRKPSRKRVAALLNAVEQQDDDAIELAASRMRGPAGRMIRTGVEHLRHPRELIEEVMYETVLTTRLRLQRFLPFIAICAASAPLLGLLGTVTGIISTFKLITLFGSGDVKTLSGGISEALITTKFGLIIAIPSLLIHAWLSRKARGIVGQMETVAVAFLNKVSKAPRERVVDIPAGERAAGGGAPDPALVRAQVNEILGDLLSPIADDNSGGSGRPGSKSTVRG